MAKSQTRKNAERLFNMFADALFHAERSETADRIRDRLFQGVPDEERIALEQLVMERRETYTPKQEREIEAMPAEETPATE